MKRRQLVIGALALSVSCIVVVAAVLTATGFIRATGKIVGVGLTVEPTTINWGTMYQTDSKIYTIHVTSTSNLNVKLSMSTEGKPVYLTLSWDKETTILTPGQSVDATLTLASLNAPQGTFAFDIIITATEV